MTQQLKGFNSYEDYLDSQLVEEDLYYLKVIISPDLSHISHLISSWQMLGCRVCQADPGAGLQVGGEGPRQGGVLQRENVSLNTTGSVEHSHWSRELASATS